ncbi:MAG TPA: hypothetical protein VEA99_11895 [Gemmatimonadaceae bacterium]|nr:hypothetical protein [Gemmatimonadaceae bacterium]
MPTRKSARTLAARAAKTVAATVADAVAKHATKKVAKKVATKLVKTVARKAAGGVAARVAVAVATPLVARAATKLAARATKSAARRAATKAAVPADLPPAFARVVRAYERDPAVTSGTMMAAVGLKVHGKIFAMLPRGRFVVKLPKARVDDLVARGIGTRFDPGHGRVMKEWLALEGHEARWLGLAREAYAYVSGSTA